MAPAFGQCTQGKEVIRQDGDVIDPSRMMFLAIAEAGTQQGDLVGEQAASPVGEVQGEEPGGI
ncbi:hypothetical protein FQZ97_805700 [compost metagenome]